jgi:hypothetical protein
MEGPLAGSECLDAGLELVYRKFRKHAGRYDHVLDILVGEKLLEAGDVDAATSLLGRALVRDPGLASAWVSLGEAYSRRLAFGPAWECFEFARGNCPHHPVVSRKVFDRERQLRSAHPQLF